MTKMNKVTKMTDRAGSPDQQDRRAARGPAPFETPPDAPPGPASDAAYVVWALYDCNEIVSLHATESAAHRARAEHLEALLPMMSEPGDDELFRNATTVTPMTVHRD